MAQEQSDIKALFERMRSFIPPKGKGIVFITAKAAPMTQAELDAANAWPRCIDYIGMIGQAR